MIELKMNYATHQDSNSFILPFDQVQRVSKRYKINDGAIILFYEASQIVFDCLIIRKAMKKLSKKFQQELQALKPASLDGFD